MAGKETQEDLYDQETDLGCVVCWKTASKRQDDGTGGAEVVDTGVKLKSCSVCKGPRLYCSRKCFKIDCLSPSFFWNLFNSSNPIILFLF